VGIRRLGRLPVWSVAYSAAMLCFAAVVLLTPLANTRFGWYADDLGDVVAAGVASACCGWRARRSQDRMRAAWSLLALACLSWALGELVWSWYQLWDNTDPFPSFADIGYLGFPVAACLALLVYPTIDGRSGGLRRFLDTSMTIGAMALISWVTVLSAVARSGLSTSLSAVLSLTYPLSDLAVLTLTMLTLARARGNRLALTLIATGLAALSLSDSLFSYLTATSSYDGGAVDLGWFAAFVILAAAPLVRQSTPAELADGGVAGRQSAAPSRLAYAPFLAAVVVTFALAAAGQRPTDGQLLLVSAVVCVLLARQYVTATENLRLASSLARRETELRHQAFHDSLTGLPNRALFLDRLSHALALHARDLRTVSAMFLDLDDFKVVNDTLGHGAGDELLSRVAERLLGAVRSGDTVARLGGDEFAILIEDNGNAAVVAETIAQALSHPFQLSGSGQRSVTASIGLVMLEPGDPPATADALVTRADTAMYAAKRAGKGQTTLYRPGMALQEVTDNALATALATDINDGKLSLMYQPIVDLETGQARAFEALARWSHEGELVPPSIFIPMAERLGLISNLTEAVMQTACRDARSWSTRLNGRPIVVSVNVPPSLITSPAFLVAVARIVAAHRLTPGQLVIEVTESGLFRDVPTARRAIAELRHLGVDVWLDDFGVGFSSLSQLHDVDFDLIKLDRSFVGNISQDPRQGNFLGGLLQLSTAIGTAVLAEGIEDSEQLAHLRELGFTLGQGYLFSRPLPPGAVVDYLSRTTTGQDAIPAPRSPSVGGSHRIAPMGNMALTPPQFDHDHDDPDERRSRLID
jgi:diguanylate cyclase